MKEERRGIVRIPMRYSELVLPASFDMHSARIPSYAASSAEGEWHAGGKSLTIFTRQGAVGKDSRVKGLNACRWRIVAGLIFPAMC